MFVGNELMHGHQLDRANAKSLQIIDHLRTSERCIGAAQLRGHGRMAHRETLHMELVDNRLVPWNRWRYVIAPAECRIYHDAFRHVGSAVAIVRRKICFAVANPITEQSIAPTHRPGNCFGIGIEEKLRWVATMTLL